MNPCTTFTDNQTQCYATRKKSDIEWIEGSRVIYEPMNTIPLQASFHELSCIQEFTHQLGA